MTDDTGKFLVFESAESLYAIDFRRIKETAIRTQYLPVDFLDPNIIGMANIKGNILSILNPFDKIPSASGIMLVISSGTIRFSILCSDLIDIININPDKIYHIQSKDTDYILEYFNYKERCVHIIDIARYITFLNKNLDSDHPHFKEVFDGK